METMDFLNRRNILKGAGLVGAGLCTGCTVESAPEPQPTVKRRIDFDLPYFYNADGTFNSNRAKDAYITLMLYHGYPVPSDIREKLWVTDYGKHEFTRLGLGAYMVVNNREHGFMMMELFMLPGQMVPEHYLLATNQNSVKMMGWFCRYGLLYVYGEGLPTAMMRAVVPMCHMNGTVATKHEVILEPGVYTQLVRPAAPHWQFAGPQGAIVTETSNYHDEEGIRFMDPSVRYPEN